MDDIDRRAHAPACETSQAFFDRHMAAMRAGRAPGQRQGLAAWWRQPMAKHTLAGPFLVICLALPAWAYVAISLFW